ncbi:galactose-specific lectin nattectin-like isoform X2 [Thrips palmi]|uniref:Galactose-specific lectin nattectin-like isoform X2 n=1 Tax=Thrips palmi TaxID=161013 RepID=A0A6P9ALL2_THRPL|nr:galactose-specific lectin nattectin-like isoform X2 [Thrips palmi]
MRSLLLLALLLAAAVSGDGATEATGREPHAAVKEKETRETTTEKGEGLNLQATTVSGDAAKLKTPSRGPIPVDTLVVGNKTFELVTANTLDWYNAVAECISKGMLLASIESQEENDLLAKYVRENGLSGSSFWIGGSDHADTGVFTWTQTGKPVTYDNFQVWPPVRYDEEHREASHCMCTYTDILLWKTDFCVNVQRPFICNKERKVITVEFEV